MGGLTTDKHELQVLINYCLIEKKHPLVHKTKLTVTTSDMIHFKPVVERSLGEMAIFVCQK